MFSLTFLKDLAKQLTHALLSKPECFVTGRSGAVFAPNPSARPHFPRSQQPFFFQTMQQGIKRARTQPVSMARQFLDHSKTKNGALARVEENVDSDQARVQVLAVHRIGSFRLAHVILFRNRYSTMTLELDSEFVKLPGSLNKAATPIEDVFAEQR
jgi:hypothetical protein